MSLEVVVVHDAGHPVVVQRGTGEAARRLRATAARLEAAAHPGVVRIRWSRGDDATWELGLDHGGRPLDVPPPPGPVALADVLAAVSATLADLHQLGVVHGRLTTRHVLLGDDRRPVLCGFGAAAPQGATPPDDVAAVGRIITELLSGSAAAEPIPTRRWRGGASSDTAVRAALLTLADQACAEPASRRPTAQRLAASLAALATSTPSRWERERAAQPGARSRRRDLPLLAAAVAASLLVAVPLLRGDGSPVGGAALSARQATPPPDAPRPPQPTGPPPAAPAAGPAAPTGPGRCPGAGPCRGSVVSPEGPAVVEIGSRAYEVGRAGDQVIVGDWDCDGQVTPAVLRPATGEVFVFPDVAAREVVVRPVRQVPAAVALEAERSPAGCDALVVRLRDGSRTPITSVGAA